MKKIYLVLIMIVVVLGLAACQTEAEQDNEIHVVASLFPQYDVVRALGEDHVELTYILPPGVSAHTYEPTASTIVSILEADIFIYASDELEMWVHDFLDTYDTGDVEVINLSEYVTMIDVEGHSDDDDHDAHDESDEHDAHNEHDDHDEEDTHDHGDTDPHFWNDPHNMIDVVNTIATTLRPLLDQDAQITLDENQAAYISRLEAIDEAMIDVVLNSDNPTLMHGGHNAMGYLIHRYDIRYVNPYNGFSSDATPTPQGIAEMIATMEAEGIDYLFSEQLLSQAVATTIQEETGADILYIYSGGNISKDDFDNDVTLLDMFEHNIAMFEIGFGYHDTTTD